MIHQSEEKPKIAIIVASVLQVKFFLEPHLKLLSQNYDVTVILNNDEPQVFKLVKFTGDFKFLPIKRKIHIMYDVYVLIHLFFYLKKQQFQVVHTINPKAGVLGISAARLANIPVRIHTFQGEVWSNKYGLFRLLLKQLDKLMANLCTHILVVSFSEKLFLESEKIIRPNKSLVLGHGSIGGVNIDIFKPDPMVREVERRLRGYSDENIVFLYLGRISTDKGLNELMNAFKQLVSIRPEARLMIVGPDEEGYLSKIQLGISDIRKYIILEAYSSDPQNIIRTADVLVLPSHREGFGVVVIEAAACGVPAIGSNIYGIQDAVVDGETGLLFQKKNPKDLFDKMFTMVDQRNMRLEMGLKARSRVLEKFDSNYLLRKFDDFYSGFFKVP